jgi:L-amino acid N-acyltransferase YncA
MIRPATTDDAAKICDIYNHYVMQATITFEELLVAPEDMTQRMTEVLETLPWFVCEEDGKFGVLPMPVNGKDAAPTVTQPNPRCI